MVAEKSKCVQLTLPDFPTDSRPEHVIVRAVGRPSVRTPGGYTFRDEMKVDTLGSWFNTDITFVQTDKPIYKPGQLGKSTFFCYQYKLWSRSK